jgi:DNA-binding transcriptional ArsR family regulator
MKPSKACRRNGAAPCGYRLTDWLTNGRAQNTINHMVEEQALDDVFHALADPTRRAMLHRLAEGERNIGQLAQPFAMSFAAASKHVRVLEGAGLVRRRVLGRLHLCRLEPAPLAAADGWLRFYERFWTEQFDALGAVLSEESAPKPDTDGESR